MLPELLMVPSLLMAVMLLRLMLPELLMVPELDMIAPPKPRLKVPELLMVPELSMVPAVIVTTTPGSITHVSPGLMIESSKTILVFVVNVLDAASAS